MFFFLFFAARAELMNNTQLHVPWILGYVVIYVNCQYHFHMGPVRIQNGCLHPI
jgi:hypothetical protein